MRRTHLHLEYAHNRSYTLKEKALVHYRRDAALLVVGFSKSGDVCIWRKGDIQC